MKTGPTIYKVELSAKHNDIAFFRNGGMVRTYRLTEKRRKLLAKHPNYYVSPDVLGIGFSAHIVRRAKA